MMRTSQADRLHHLYGVTTDDQGNLKPDWKSFSLPDCLSPTLGKLPASKSDLGNAFFKAYGVLAGKPGLDLYRAATEDHKALGSADQVNTLATALTQAGGVSRSDAFALANYAGGGVLHKGLLGISPTAPDSSDYLDPSSLVAADDKQTNIEQALLRLKAANPMAHNYLLALVGAKAAKRASQEAFVHGKDTQKVINAELAAVKGAAALVGDAATAVSEAAGAAGFLLRNWLWIAGAVALVGGYFYLRKR